ncbi:cleavage stimulation factor subunit 1-like [Babylonia areolata]|uniref:cleavage stimulation factor subunit 1-like n=1 Tax=Babylonia areolata TaxID=304850 RepID=UPI003FCFCA60
MSETEEALNVKHRETMYRLMISQLFYDGYKETAVSLAQILKPYPACPPSDRLFNIFQMGFKQEEEKKDEKDREVPKVNSYAPVGAGIDLEFETEVQTISAEAALYETCYVTAHKSPCRTARFHPTGQLVATGSDDCSIKILDVDRMLAKSATPVEVLAMETHQQQMENHPVIRTLYDHADEVMCLDFHPFSQILASGSRDCTLRFFEYSKPSVKKAYKSVQEAAPVRAVSFHPSGDYLTVGTEQPTLRLYDARTLQCYVGSNPQDQHKGPITGVHWSPNANLYTSCSKDGDIKVWDGVSSKCITTFRMAHQGQQVCSVFFSRNSKYILSSGKDSLVKLWELSTNRCLIVYTGAGATGKMEQRTQAVFNHTEDYVLFPDEKTTSLCCWDSRNAERQNLLALGHNGPVRALAHSPTGPAFISCSEDFRARFWYRKATTD